MLISNLVHHVILSCREEMFTQALSMPLRSTGTYFMYNYSVKHALPLAFLTNILTDFLRMNEDISATSQKL